MEYNTSDRANGGKIGSIRDHSRKIMQEINDLQYSIDVVENDMESSIQKIRHAANTFSEPRRRRLHTLLAELAQLAHDHRALLFPEQPAHICHMETPDGSFGFAPILTICPVIPNKSPTGALAGPGESMDESVAVHEGEQVSELASWPEEQLRRAGLQRKTCQVFWYETKGGIMVSPLNHN
ncbi:MAG: hypothetical protein HQL77_12070 [Magnetococcales bacterium]|nr:hypothetical protein [Magnetococcales bacterium]